MSQNLPIASGPFGIFCLYVILTISYLRARTIETSPLPTDAVCLNNQHTCFAEIVTQKTVWFGSNTCTTRYHGLKASGTQLWHPSHLTGKFSKRYKRIKNSRLNYLWLEPSLIRKGLHASAIFILFISWFFFCIYHFFRIEPWQGKFGQNKLKHLKCIAV